MALVLCSGVPMNAKPVPLHCQLPAKYFSSFSFGFGPGGASAARADEAAKARTMMGKRIRFMQSLLSVVRSLARIHVADALAYLTRCTTARTAHAFGSRRVRDDPSRHQRPAMLAGCLKAEPPGKGVISREQSHDNVTAARAAAR